MLLLPKLSRGNLCQLTMPPKVATGWRGNYSVSVGSTHPANVAATKKKAAATATGSDAAVLTHMSPPRDAKSVASVRIAEQISPPVRVPVASVAPAMAETTPGVSISFVSDKTERSPKRAKSSVSSVDGSQNLCPAECEPMIPPLWNAWYSACCRIVTYVGDGGVLKGKCGKCGNACPLCKHTMLDPDQIGKLEKTPAFFFDALMEVDSIRTSSHSGLSTSNPRGNARIKYILSVLVHKDNKDIVTNPTKQPPGLTCKKVREKSKKLIAEEHAVDRLDRRVEVQDDNGAVKTIKLGDVEIDAKRPQVDGMWSVIEKNTIDSIKRKITIMQKMEQIYVGRFGREWYEKQLLNLVNQLPGMLASGGESDGGMADQTTTPQSSLTGTFCDVT